MTKSYDASAYKEFADSQAQLISSQSGARTAEMVFIAESFSLATFEVIIFFFRIWDFFVLKIELLTAYDVHRTA